MTKELSTEITMTAKEVSQALGVTTEAIKWHVRKLYPDCIKNGVAIRLTEKQVTEIKKKMIPTSQLVAASTDTEMVEKTAEVINWLSDKIQEIKAEKDNLQIQLDEAKKWYSVKRVKNLGYLEKLSARKMWSPLKKWSIKNDYQIISIFDANYGEVKTYHADAWKAVYGVVL